MTYELKAVSFGSVAEDIQRVLYDLISQYFDGTEESIGDRSFDFNDCDIVFNKQRLENEVEKPLIAILGERVSSSSEHKRTDPDSIRDFAYEEWIAIDRTVYIKLPLQSNANINLAFRTATRVYDLLHACFSSKHAALASYGIDRPSLTASPIDLSTKEFIVLSGRLKFKVRVVVKRDDN